MNAPETSLHLKTENTMLIEFAVKLFSSFSLI